MNFSYLFRKEQAHPTNNMNNRQNCVVMDFSVMPAKPKPARIDEFVAEKVQLDWSRVKGLQLNNIMSYVFVKMDSLEAAEDLVEQNNLKHSMEYKGNQYAIPFFVADGAVDVKLHDLPFDMSNITIAEQMSQYGEVLSIKNDTWKTLFKGLPNGVRILRMRIAKSIPSYVLVAGEMSLVTHKNQIPTCRHCGRRVHYTMKCSEYAKSLLHGNMQIQPTPNTEQNNTSHQQSERTDDNTSLISPVASRTSSADRTTAAASATATAAHARMSTTTNANGLPSSSCPLPPLKPGSSADMEVISQISDTEIDEVGATPTPTAKGNSRSSSPLVKSRNTSQETFKRPGSPRTKNHDNKRASRSRNRN